MTRRQSEALAFIAAFIEREGYSPSYREIAAGIGLSSHTNAHRIVRCLEAQGYVTFARGCGRTLRLVKQAA